MGVSWRNRVSSSNSSPSSVGSTAFDALTFVNGIDFLGNSESPCLGEADSFVRGETDFVDIDVILSFFCVSIFFSGSEEALGVFGSQSFFHFDSNDFVSSTAERKEHVFLISE